MTTVGLPHYLAVGAALFCIGAIGFLSRRNLILMFLSAEMMLQGVALNMVAFSRHYGNMHGQIFTMFLIAVAACEAGIALALIISLYRRSRSLDISVWQDLREPDTAPMTDLEPLPKPEPEEDMPRLPVAGREPAHEETYYA